MNHKMAFELTKPCNDHNIFRFEQYVKTVCQLIAFSHALTLSISISLLLFIPLQALRLGQDANSPGGFYNRHRCQMCLRSDTLHKVMERLTNPGKLQITICNLTFIFLMNLNCYTLKGILPLT